MKQNLGGIVHRIAAWPRRDAVLVLAAAVASVIAAVSGGLTAATASEPRPAASSTPSPKPTFTADAVPEDVPTSGEDAPFVVVPDETGEQSWGSARRNPNGTGSVNVSVEGDRVVIRFTGNCGPNAYISSKGDAWVTMTANVTGVLSRASLCLPSSRTDSSSLSMASGSCHADTQVTVSVSGTPGHDGSWTVPVRGFQRPCPGEWDRWDWTTNSPRVEPPSTTPVTPPVSASQPEPTADPRQTAPIAPEPSGTPAPSTDPSVPPPAAQPVG